MGDLMAALEASVVAAKAARTDAAPQPMSAGKAVRPGRAARLAVAVGPGHDQTPAEEGAAAVPARRRKSA
jgi:hypothetical protein